MSTAPTEIAALAEVIERIPLRHLGWSANARDIAESLLASDALADLVAVRDRRVRAEALREAATAALDEPESVLPAIRPLTRWLHLRADRIEAGA